ncbi:hypothetical protein [Serratia fonticola]
MKIAMIALTLLAVTSSPYAAEQVCYAVDGAVLIAQDEQNTKLGNISSSYDSDSIFNEYGTYGSEYNSSSIWNSYGTFGSEYSQYSPFNSYSRTPPMIIKQGKIIGYLSANKHVGNAISPNLLKALCKDEL